MIEFIYISLSLYFSLGCFVLIGYVLEIKKEKQILTSSNSKIDLKELAVIIPFRNEEKRLTQLVRDLNKQTSFPEKFLFIDDHSTDNSHDIIHLLKQDIPYEILQLPKDQKGKKSAIRFGVSHTKAEFNLTWDADIRLPENYFENIKQLPKSDLYILPVVMTGQNLKELYFESDHAIANAINMSTHGWIRPFLASGANLLFRQNTFLKTDSFVSHAHISSGDDMFLLQDFRKNKSSIAVITNSNFAVTTETPASWQEFIDQRLRWIGKNTLIKDHLSTSMAFTSLIFNLIFYSLYCYQAINNDWETLFLLFNAKSLIDLIVYAPYFIRIKRMITWLLLPLFSIIQPIYLLILLLLIPFYTPKWKGRKINGEC